MAEPAPQQRGRDTPQPLSFSDFLEKMKDPGAADLVRVIKAFLKEFEDRGAAPPPRGAAADPQADSDRVQAFLEGTERLFRSHPAWRGSPPEVLDQAVEGLEKYVMSKVWRQVFGAWGEDAERDERYARLAQALSFVDLDALAGARGAAPDPALLALAQGELLRMDRYKAPRDKLLCLVNVKTMVEDVVVAAAAASGTPGGGLGGADAFFPVLLLVAIRARPPRLASNIEYLKRFRMRSRLTGQFDYMLANLESVALYLDTVNYEHLRISQADFLAHLAAAGLPEAHRELSALRQAEEKSAAAAAAAAAPAAAAAAAAGPAADGASAPAVIASAVIEDNPFAAAPPASAAALFAEDSPSSDAEPQPWAQPPAAALDLLSLSPGPEPAAPEPAPAEDAAGSILEEASTMDFAAAASPMDLPAAAPVEGEGDPGTPPASPRPGSAEPGLTPVNTGPTPAALAPRPLTPAEAEASPASPPPRALDYGLPPSAGAGSPRWAVVDELVREGLGSVLRAEAAGELGPRYPYMYAEAEDLSVEDVRRLLLAYKELMLRLEGLTRGLQQQWDGEQRQGTPKAAGPASEPAPAPHRQQQDEQQAPEEAAAPEEALISMDSGWAAEQHRGGSNGAQQESLI